MRKRSSQAGFSLIELLISLIITVIATLAAVALMTKYARTAGAHSEVSTMEEARASSETLLRADFDGAGYNLTRPSPQLAGTIPNAWTGGATPPDFNTNVPGTITKISPTGWSGIVSTYGLSMGLGSFTSSMPNDGGYLEIYNSAGQYRMLMAGFGNPSAGVWMGIYEDGENVADTCCAPVVFPPHLAGDSYTISIEMSDSSPSMTRVLKYYRIRSGSKTLLYTSTKPLPLYPIGMANGVYYQGDTITNSKITGAPIVNLYTNGTDVPPMPIDNGLPLTSPVTPTAGGTGATILSGDTGTDAVPTLTEINRNSTTVDVRQPQRGSFAEGDIVMAIDYGDSDPTVPASPATAVCRVTGVSANSGVVTLTLERVRSANPAWNRLWSSDADHLHTFAVGATTLVKLKAPVTYAVSTNQRLVRVEGDRASTIAFNARSFSVTPEVTPFGNRYSVSATLAAEGFETNATDSSETLGTINIHSSPRALNLGSNQLQ